MNETETFFEGKIKEKVTILGCCLKNCHRGYAVVSGRHDTQYSVIQHNDI
jgi:hypothetical protein